MTRLITEKRLYQTFEISILLKGLHAVIEILGGILFLLFNKSIVGVATWFLTISELSEDPNDFIAKYLIKVTSNLSLSGEHFIALYLLSHGLIKLTVLIGLYKKKIWAYPASVIVFTGFIVYQLHRYYYTHSFWLLVFTIFDLVVIYLTFHEYRRVRRDFISS
jgi:uncharacterized membrane protein